MAVEPNELADDLASAILGFTHNDAQWRLFGFRGAPTRGLFWDRFVGQERLAVETFVFRELAILATAVTIQTLRSTIVQDWRVPLAARVLQQTIGTRPLQRFFKFPDFEAARAYFLAGVEHYLARPRSEWHSVLLSRAPVVRQQRFRAGLFTGAALMFVPTRSLLPHVDGAAQKVCLASDPQGHVSIRGDIEKSLLESATSLMRTAATPIDSDSGGRNGVA